MLEIAAHKLFEGQQLRFQHNSRVLNCGMRFSLYLPPQSRYQQVPVLFWLSGLTCTDENFTHKAGAQRYAAEKGIALLAPDTSPRGEKVPDDADNSWDFGQGAGFYLNASQNPWSQHYQMESYICEELPGLLREFAVQTHKFAVAGHSMGGHGAISLGLKHPELFTSISAFAPICAASQCPWGEKAFSQYLGSDKKRWQEHDCAWLVEHGKVKTPLLVDQGSSDDFLEEQLKPEQLKRACEKASHPLVYNLRSGYDHSYYFIASFIGEHIAWHAKNLT